MYINQNHTMIGLYLGAMLSRQSTIPLNGANSSDSRLEYCKLSKSSLSRVSKQEKQSFDGKCSPLEKKYELIRNSSRFNPFCAENSIASKLKVICLYKTQGILPYY